MNKDSDRNYLINQISEIYNEFPATFQYRIKKYPKLQNFLIEQTPLLNVDDNFEYKMATRFYWVFHGLTNFPKCLNCGKTIGENINIKFSYGYHAYCSLSCRSSAKEIIDKIKQTNKRRYGVECTVHAPHIKKQVTETMLEKYGVENVFQSKKVRQQIKETNIERYGHENVFGSEIIKERIKQNNLEHYGVEFNVQRKDVKKKISNANKNKSEHEKKLILKKRKKTNKKKFGKNWPQQTRQYHKRVRKKKFDGISFDSSLEIEVYKFCKKHNLDFIVHPETCINYSVKGEDTERSYFPDFLINKRLVETKGNHFFRIVDGKEEMFLPFKSSNGKKLDEKEYEFLCLKENAKFHCMKENNVLIIRDKKDFNKLLSL